jgi:phage terminase Nu1 subunit (DNA packaging protein)
VYVAKKKEKKEPGELQGWQEIAQFLGLPVTTVQRWQKSGMPVHHGGRYVYARPEELNQWIRKESPSHPSAHVATENENLTADLKQALAEAKRRESVRKAA